MNLGAKRTKTFPDDSVSGRRRLHRPITSHTTNQVLFFCTKSGKYYDRIDYIYTHTLHAKYCKHFVFPFLIFDFLWLYFLLPETIHVLLYVPLLKHYSAPAWMTSDAAVWKNKISTLSWRTERSPEAVSEDERRKVERFYFCLPAGFLWRCYSEMLLR